VKSELADRAAEILDQCGTTIAPALRGAVAQLHDDRLRALVEYHLGWRNADGSVTEGRTGKGLRGAVTLLTAKAVGGSSDVALPGAVAVELVHNFSLLHDDIIDDDRYRRGRETVWSLHGVGWGVLTGDALLVLAVQQLSSSTQPAGAGCVADLVNATAEMIHGQAEDMVFEHRQDVTLDECLTMVRRKSGALLGCAASLGARLGGARPDQVEGLTSFGHHLGIVFQATDDLLGIWGDPARTGKPVASDLASRKKSIPITAAMTGKTPASKALAAVLAHDEVSEASLARAVDLVDEAGGRARTMELIEEHVQRATERLDGLDLNSDAVDDLRALAKFAACRDS
jgi:geranylgeranyl diphosphate synthase type I